jgi:hypothetical protein
MGPRGYEPYAPPAPTGGRPPVIMWFRLYAFAMAVMYLGLFALFMFDPLFRASPGNPSIVLMRAALALVGCANGVASFIPHRPWAWTYGLVVIALGTVSCVFIITIPLLVYWLKPVTKAAFGRL